MCNKLYNTLFLVLVSPQSFMKSVARVLEEIQTSFLMQTLIKQCAWTTLLLSALLLCSIIKQYFS